MIFLLLCNAAPAMVKQYPGSDKRSAKSRWIEIDSQVLNALFCVTGFGLAPWRIRDTILLYKYRVKKDFSGLDRLATIHKGWFRIDGAGPRNGPHEAHPTAEAHAAAELESRYPRVRLTRSGQLAPASPVWTMDGVVLANMMNTVFQCCLAGVMWGLNRYNRPSWTTALFIVFAFGCGIAAGVIIFTQGKRVKKIEGRPLELSPPSVYDISAVDVVEQEVQEKKQEKEKKTLKEKFARFKNGQ